MNFIRKQSIFKLFNNTPVLWNSGIVPFKDTYLVMCHSSTNFDEKLYTFLDKATFTPVSSINKFTSHSTGDFRLLVLRGQYYACYYTKKASYKSGIVLHKFSISDDYVITWDSSPILLEPIEDWAGYQKVRAEKNWMPFIHNEELYFVYSVCPHVILKFNEHTKKAERVQHTSADMSAWKLGEFGFSGNANCVQIGDMYLGTFHSKPDRNYWTGYYFFNASPPFNIKLLGRVPLFNPVECVEVQKSARVARAFDNVQFPVGLHLEDQNNVLISYGVNDVLQYIARVKVSDLLAAAVKV